MILNHRPLTCMFATLTAGQQVHSNRGHGPAWQMPATAPARTSHQRHYRPGHCHCGPVRARGDEGYIFLRPDGST
jgi:hypothetical protein